MGLRGQGYEAFRKHSGRICVAHVDEDRKYVGRDEQEGEAARVCACIRTDRRSGIRPCR